MKPIIGFCLFLLLMIFILGLITWDNQSRIKKLEDKMQVKSMDKCIRYK